MDLQRLGKYQIVAKIGQGAMGEVFKAHDPVIGRDVAIKLMAAAVGDNEELRRRFQREAQSAGRLNHPNIVTIYEFGEDQGRIFIAMELLEGRDLKELISRPTPLTLEEKLDLVQQICEGLAFAHSKEVIHRDLKPANIHRLPSGLVKIMDFGLAKYAASDITGSGMILGTPHYMAPEQMRGEKATAQSDVFSLGVLFYELLSHRKPFTADSLPAILFQVMHGDPEPLARAAPGVPRAIAAVVERALDKDLDRRHRDAEAMRQALRQALPGNAAPSRLAPAPLESTWRVPALPPAPPRPAASGRPGRTLALLSAAGAGFLLLFSAVGFMAYRFSLSAPPTAPPTLATRPPPPPTTAASAAPASPVAVERRGGDRARVEPERAPKVVADAVPPASPPPAFVAPPRPSAAPVVPVPTRPPASSATPTPPPSTPPSPTPRPPPNEALAVQEIQRVLSRYRSAFEALDVDALKSVHPGVNERSARQLFASVKAYDVGLEVERISVSGLVATAECVGTYDPIPKPARARSKPLRQLFELTWDGESWRIVRVHTRP